MAKPVVLTQPYEIVLHKGSGMAQFCVRAKNLDNTSTVTLAPSTWNLINQNNSHHAEGVIRVKAKYTGTYVKEIEADQIQITVTNTDAMMMPDPSVPVKVPVFVDET